MRARICRGNKYAVPKIQAGEPTVSEGSASMVNFCCLRSLFYVNEHSIERLEKMYLERELHLKELNLF